MKTIVLVILLTTLLPNVVSAKRVGGIFGKSERIINISDVDIKGPNGEELYLAYKTTSVFFIMGVYMSNDGYVLGVKKSFNTYYPLSEEKIKELQKSGALPVILPTYKIPLTEWLWGFSFWMLLIVVATIYFFPKGKEANFIAGCKHYFGKKVPLDYKKAFKYFIKSANKGHAAAQYNLGIMYLKGQSVTKNHELSISYFEKAANQEHIDAQFTLGKLYLDGTIVTKDIKKARLFFKNACDKGDSDACAMLKKL